MGICGTGKSTLGMALARQLNAQFIEADEFHSTSNIEKMSQGIPLTDADREPWLHRLNQEARTRLDPGGKVVLACSSLKERYREILMHGLPPPVWLLLTGSTEVLKERMRQRKDHYMPVSQIEDQLNNLEVPAYAIPLDFQDSPEALLRKALAAVAES